MHPIEVLEHYWKYTAFKPLQEDIINAVCNNEDTFALLPTGGGKSICFQIPALLKPGICIVISPLIALMKDQVNQLKNKGIKAIALTSGITYDELDTMLDNCVYGNYKFLYISPERLQQAIVKERIQQMPVNLIAVDEAHCISQWGNDFRPAYKHISILRQLHPNVNCIALTATAKSNVIKDIINSLDLVGTKIFKASFKRNNIGYKVINTEDKDYELKRILDTYLGSSIIYVRSRKASVEVNSFLNANGFSSAFFHGGISSNEKIKRLNQWAQNQTRIMVATTAFGMGINKPDVETVIHYNLPDSLESYYQEAGRAGRNGNKAYAILLKKPIDEDVLKSQFLNNLPKVDDIKHIYRKLSNYFHISYGEVEQTSYQLRFDAFCNTYQLKAGLVYNTLQFLDRVSIIRFNQRFNYSTVIQFLVSNDELFNYMNNDKTKNISIKALLRTYGGIFDHPTKINLEIISEKANQSEKQLIAILKDLENQGIISLDIANSDTEITFLQPREDDKAINPLTPIIKQQQQLKEDQIKAVIEYSTNTKLCKSIQLLSYFEEFTSEVCGQCSVCMASKTNNPKTSLINEILKSLKFGEKNSRELQQQLQCSSQDLIMALKALVKENSIKVTAKNTYIINEN